MAQRATDTQVIAPRQARSRATMERIVTTTEELLAEKPFEEITIAEISAKAGCAPPAIYARFSDKTALLLELHARFIRRAAETATSPTGAITGIDADDEAFIRHEVAEWTELYRTNHRLLRSMLLSDNPTVYRRASELTKQISRRLATALHHSIGVDGTAAHPDEDDAAARDLDFAVRTALAILQQDLIFGPDQPTRFEYGPDEIAHRVADGVVAAFRRHRHIGEAD
ncbi:TetR/AcrR family transcriptional regulator [Gordonia sp. NB41Y]|uniref:TetR/AcrR family transcriptional regulator n=1 Tax=Gordonia sp. NB41Y TaxID=875808 RepID=UPI0002BF5218|nr:TetR/AcrR family transcriptional regulator [Gordonia sp. NB41Y]WLP91842.1 TetR/AcrR family transcriptional regulator [Gordonia sp. NB41Y]